MSKPQYTIVKRRHKGKGLITNEPITSYLVAVTPTVHKNEVFGYLQLYASVAQNSDPTLWCVIEMPKRNQGTAFVNERYAKAAAKNHYNQWLNDQIESESEYGFDPAENGET